MGAKLKLLNTLSRLYVLHIANNEGVDSEGPPIVIRNKDKCFPVNKTELNKAIVLKHEDRSVNIFCTLSRILFNNVTATYIPISQKLDTIL